MQLGARWARPSVYYIIALHSYMITTRYNNNSIPSGYSLLYACDIMSCMCIVPLWLKEPKCFSKVPPTLHQKAVTAKHDQDAERIAGTYEELTRTCPCGPKGHMKPDQDAERIRGTYNN